MATSGMTTSHLRTWYSIHSRLIMMSPSTNLNRGSPRLSSSLWLPTSIPYTSQSFWDRIARVSELPIKPLAPRIRTRRGMDDPVNHETWKMTRQNRRARPPQSAVSQNLPYLQLRREGSAPFDFRQL